MKVTLDTRLLVESGIIDDATEQAIINFSSSLQAARLSGTQKLSIVLAILASLLVGSGAIILLAHNWDSLPFVLRLAISFIPLTAGLVLGGVTLFKAKGTAMRESSCVLIITGIAVALALVSQIYHINGELGDFLLSVLAMSIPFIYIFGSAAGIIAAAGMLWILLDNSTDWSMPVFFIVLLPAIIYHLRRYPAAISTVVWRLAVVSMLFTIAIPATEHLHSSLIPVMLAQIFAAIFAFGINEQRSRGITFLRSPGLFFGFVALALLLGISSYCSISHDVCFYTDNLLETLNKTLWLPVLFSLFILKNAWCDRSATSWMLVPAFLGVLFFPAVYTGLLAAALMFDGMRRNQIFSINTGMIFALILAFDFFIYDGDIITRGCSFIGAGIALSVINLLIAKKFGGEKNA